MSARPGAPLDPAIRAKHRELLDTLREFFPDLLSASRGPDPHGLRALVSFLRESLLPFARREEDLLGDRHRRESAALDHAFLAAEIDRLAGAIHRYLGSGGASARDGSVAEVRRLACRIEAVLELHLLREAEHGAPEAVPTRR